MLPDNDDQHLDKGERPLISNGNNQIDMPRDEASRPQSRQSSRNSGKRRLAKQAEISDYTAKKRKNQQPVPDVLMDEEIIPDIINEKDPYSQTIATERNNG